MGTLLLTVLFVFIAGTLAWSIYDSDSGDGLLAQIWAIILLLMIYIASVVDVNSSDPIVHKSTVEVCPVVTETTVITNGDTVKTVEYTYSFPKE